MRRAADPLTMDLFDVPAPPAPVGGSLDYGTELRLQREKTKLAEREKALRARLGRSR